MESLQVRRVEFSKGGHTPTLSHIIDLSAYCPLL